MKITAPLLLLPLLLAACGTQSATPAPQSSLLGNSARATGPTYVEAFEAGVQRDLTALGLSGSISAQATAPKSYLNVLKVSDTTARAYMKTTYPAETGCTLDWGDGTVAATITTPSVVATDKADHIYTQSGTYTIKLTCGTDIKTSTFTAVVPLNNLDLFKDFTSNSWYFTYYLEGGGHDEVYTNVYKTKGFVFPAAWMVRPSVEKTPNARIIRCGNEFSTESGSVFDVDAMTAGTLYNANVAITAYGASGNVVGVASYSNDFDRQAPLETRNFKWKSVKRISASCSGLGYFVLQDMAAKIQLPPL